MSASELILTDKKPTEYQSNESSMISDLLSMITQLTEQNKNFLDTINSQAGTIAELTRELEWFRRNMFGKKSEKSRGFDYDDPDFHQQSLFDSMTEEQKQLLGIAGEDTEEKPPEKITINSYKRTRTERKKKRTREELLANARKGEDRRIYASDQEKICDWCNSEMSHLGWEYIRTEVEHIPEQIVYHEVYAEKLICKRCKVEDNSFEVKTAEVAPAFIPHSFTTPSLVSFVGYQKYQMAVPNYRLEKHFERKGIFISRSSMCSWLIWVAENMLFIPYEVLHQMIKKRFIVNVDETVAPVNKIKERTV